jgi:hypothetical protein
MEKKSIKKKIQKNNSGQLVLIYQIHDLIYKN